jgi:hypothetical protein
MKTTNQMLENILKNMQRMENENIPVEKLIAYIKGGTHVYPICESPDDYRILEPSYGA